MNRYNYITDAFTKAEDNVNLEIDNLNVGCITSKNNNFNIDSNGNLTANSINIQQGLMSQQGIINLIYPVGSIYMSVNSTSPSTLFGGTRQSWGNGRVPVGVDPVQLEFNIVEKMGGEKTHELSTKELPQTIPRTRIANSGEWSLGEWGSHNSNQEVWTSCLSGQYDVPMGNEAHNNLQPYITCYM